MISMRLTSLEGWEGFDKTINCFKILGDKREIDSEQSLSL